MTVEETNEKSNNESLVSDEKVTTNETELNQMAEDDKSSENQATAETSVKLSIEDELAEMKDKYLRLYSEFENYKRRTSKDRLDTLRFSNQEMISAILPVIDDFERASKSMEKAQDVKSIMEGVQLIQNKLISICNQKGLKEMEAFQKPFDSDYHEAITNIPAPNEDLKGKVIDVVEKGYFLHDKVIRFAKVVVGE